MLLAEGIESGQEIILAFIPRSTHDYLLSVRHSLTKAHTIRTQGTRCRHSARAALVHHERQSRWFYIDHKVMHTRNTRDYFGKAGVPHQINAIGCKPLD